MGLIGFCIKIAQEIWVSIPQEKELLKIRIVYFSVNFKIKFVASWGQGRDEKLELQITSMCIIGHS